MRPRAAIAGFLRAPARQRRVVLEALAELARARLLTMLPMRVFMREFGRLDPPAGGSPPRPAAAGQGAVAQGIGDTVAAVARHVPFRALCLQQAIAVSRMLARRGVPAAVTIGVNRDRARLDGPAEPFAHAWVEVGGRVVSGAGDLGRFLAIARFG